MIKSLRCYWEYDHLKKDKKDQILIIEKCNFKVSQLMKGIDNVVNKFIKKHPLFSSRREEIKEIMENFLIDVAESQDLNGEMK